MLSNHFSSLAGDGTLYFGFPILHAAEGALHVDALVISPQFGLMAFVDATATNSPDHVFAIQDSIAVALEDKLRQNPALRSRRNLVFEYRVIAVTQSLDDPVHEITTIELLQQRLPSLYRSIPEELVPAIRATIEDLIVVKRRTPRTTSNPASLGATLAKIDSKISDLDETQREIALSYTNGPERIRGLAGSGKTIIIALKAALLHIENPDWQIAIVFYTRSLYQQFRELVSRLCYSKGVEPNWNNLLVLHAWGGSQRSGLYYLACKTHGVSPVTFEEARLRNPSAPFHYACQSFLQKVGVDRIKPTYDAILIDEAQDLDQPFFPLAFGLAKEPKRVTYAYDELQNLSDAQMAPPEELFGLNERGDFRISTHQLSDKILYRCYRNTPWALTIAHALGFGIYRKTPAPLVQFFHDTNLWRDIGYEVVKGDLRAGSKVSLRRSTSSYPSFMIELIKEGSAASTHAFDSAEQQIVYVANRLEKLMREEELGYRDFLIVLPNPRTARSESGMVLKILGENGIPAHVVGQDSSPDEVFVDGSIAIANVFRAKGNEAPYVFVINAHHCYEGWQLAKRRNALFTAITRSKAWVEICGVGDPMVKLGEEVKAVFDNKFELTFIVPTEEELSRIKKIHRDRSAEEIKLFSELSEALGNIRKLLAPGVDLEDLEYALSPEEMEALKRIANLQ